LILSTLRVNSIKSILLASSVPFLALAEDNPVLEKIALGSCNHQSKDPVIFEAIIDAEPDLFLFLGDNVYADTEDEAEMRATYQKLADKPVYQKLKQTCPILAVWDDHDYGLNDSGVEFSAKIESEKVFHDFFETKADSPSLTRPGIYDVHYFGGGDRVVQIIQLDARYFRSPFKKLPKRHWHGPYDRSSDPADTMLGEDQWKWLAETLKEPANLRIIMSSVQFIPEQHRWELWANFPLERAKLLSLLAKTEQDGVVILSGDRHMGELSMLSTEDELSPGYPVYEITSSGLTNAGGGKPNEPNKHRVGASNFQKRNFGMVVIDWEERSASLQLHDVEGKIVNQVTMPFAQN
ncbi:MAG: alkaline phosphatase D family protein, partial [Verrucomicrobiota bacterium]